MFGGGPAPPLSERMFKKYDADGSGSIDSKEFQHLCFSLGYALSTPEIALAVKTLDSDGSGTIEMKEFTTWWKKEDRWGPLKLDEAAVAVRQQAADTFNQYDTDKSGKIVTTGFTEFHASLVEAKLTTKDRDTCLADLDTSRDGAIQFYEYIDWLERIGTIEIKCEREAPTGGGMVAATRPKAGGPPGIAAGITGVTLKPGLSRPPSSTPAKSAAASPPPAASTVTLKPAMARAPSSTGGAPKAEAKAEAAPQLKPVTLRATSTTPTVSSAPSPKAGAGAGAGATVAASPKAASASASASASGATPTPAKTAAAVAASPKAASGAGTAAAPKAGAAPAKTETPSWVRQTSTPAPATGPPAAKKLW